MPTAVADTLMASEATTDALVFEDVYRDHFDFVWRNVKRLGAPPSAADDAVQKVFLVVHRRLGELRGEIRMRSWLFQIIRRVVRDERRASKLLQTEGSDALDRLVSTREGPEEAYVQKSAASRLYAILDAMDEDRREAFILAELEGFTAPEIAETTHTNLNTVYARVRAAREDLERALARLRARDGTHSWNR